MFIFCEPENLGQVGKENTGQIELGTVANLSSILLRKTA